MIDLDSNVVIALLNGRPLTVRKRFDAARNSGVTLAMSAIVFHEVMYGAAASERRRDNEEKIALLVAAGDIALVPFEEADARHAAEIRAHLRRLGTPIGPYDLLIAAQARRRDSILVTANGREFERVPHLRVIDWAA
jgi:tRNA(fMet)-specific endonuclease VapC